MFASLVMLPLSGCLQVDDDAHCSEKECGPVEFRQGLLPLAVGNSWTFRDEDPLDTAGLAETFILTVTGRDSAAPHENGEARGVWWSLGVTPPEGGSRSYAWLAPVYGAEGDSVYERQNTPTGSYVAALKYLVPAGQDTVRWSSTFGGDVAITVSAVRIPGPVMVPAGTYDSCVAYAYPGASGPHAAVLCPGVGWVSFDEGGRRIRLASAIIRS